MDSELAQNCIVNRPNQLVHRAEFKSAGSVTRPTCICTTPDQACVGTSSRGDCLYACTTGATSPLVERDWSFKRLYLKTFLQYIHIFFNRGFCASSIFLVYPLVDAGRRRQVSWWSRRWSLLLMSIFIHDASVVPCRATFFQSRESVFLKGCYRPTVNCGYLHPRSYLKLRNWFLAPPTSKLMYRWFWCQNWTSECLIEDSGFCLLQRVQALQWVWQVLGVGKQ